MHSTGRGGARLATFTHRWHDRRSASVAGVNTVPGGGTFWSSDTEMTVERVEGRSESLKVFSFSCKSLRRVGGWGEEDF
jgi:hypothetical protein